MFAVQPSILFLNHSGSRNGASLLLLHLVEWLRVNTSFRLEVLSDGGGPLIDDFRSVVPTHVWRNPLQLLSGLKRPWVNGLRSNLEGPLLRAHLKQQRYDLVYANTAAMGKYVAALMDTKPVLLW